MLWNLTRNKRNTSKLLIDLSMVKMPKLKEILQRSPKQGKNERQFRKSAPCKKVFWLLSRRFWNNISIIGTNSISTIKWFLIRKLMLRYTRFIGQSSSMLGPSGTKKVPKRKRRRKWWWIWKWSKRVLVSKMSSKKWKSKLPLKKWDHLKRVTISSKSCFKGRGMPNWGTGSSSGKIRLKPNLRQLTSLKKLFYEKWTSDF